MSSRKSFALPVNVQNATRQSCRDDMGSAERRLTGTRMGGWGERKKKTYHNALAWCKWRVASGKWQMGKVPQVPPICTARMWMKEKPRARASRFSSPLDLIKKSSPSPVGRALHEGTQQVPFLTLSQGRTEIEIIQLDNPCSTHEMISFKVRQQLGQEFYQMYPTDETDTV
jgi:hypothetical protein